MTVTTAISNALYAGNGATTVFPVPFYFLVNTDVMVQKLTGATGIVSTLVLNSDYTLAGAGVEAGGALTMTVAPLAADEIYVSRSVDIVQETAYPSNSPFPASSHEMALDRLTMIAQQLSAKVSLCLERPPLFTDYQLNGSGITGIANAVNPSDVPSYSQVQSMIVGGAVPQLGTNLGATLVGYQIAGSPGGSVLRTQAQKNADIVSVKDFGALGNGVADDTAAIAACLAAFPAGELFFPAGTYVLASSVAYTGPLRFAPGAILSPKTGAVVSISGSITAGEQQIFSNAGGGTFALSGLAVFCRATWFGLSLSNTAAANTSAFTFMLAAMPASSGCHILFPAGQINVNSCTHAKNGVLIEGHGEGTWLVNNTTNAFALEATGAGNFHNEFRNFRIGQAAGVTPVAGNGGVHVQSQLSKVVNCNCFNFPAALFDGIFIDGFIGGWVEGNTCANLINNGFHLGGGCGDIMMRHNYAVANAQNGFYFNGSSGIYMGNVSCFSNGVSAFYFDSTGHANGSGTINEFFFGNNIIGDTSGGNNWNILNLSDSVLTNCWGSFQQSHSVNTFAPGFNISGSGCNEITFTGCLALTNNGDGFLVDQGATNIRFIGCEARGNGQGGNAGVNNGFHLGFGAAVTNITLIGNRARGNAGGIFLGAFASDYCVISSNNNQGNTGGTIVNNATGTHNAVGTGANV